MEQLYPALLRMLVVLRAMGRGEEYTVSVPAYDCNEDLKQVAEEDMLIHNRNFLQSTELVCLQLFCIVLVSSLSYCLILMRSLACYYCNSKHDLPVPRVPISTEGCREVVALR